MRTEGNIASGVTSVKVHAPPGGKTTINIFGGNYSEDVNQISQSKRGGAMGGIKQN